jgi:hypothetical protein
VRDVSGTVRLIDYEHARYDLAARDLVRLATRVWPSRPDLKDAFVSSYGTLDDLDLEVIEHASYLDVLTATARAHGRSVSLDDFGPVGASLGASPRITDPDQAVGRRSSDGDREFRPSKPPTP